MERLHHYWETFVPSQQGVLTSGHGWSQVNEPQSLSLPDNSAFFFFFFVPAYRFSDFHLFNNTASCFPKFFQRSLCDFSTHLEGAIFSVHTDAASFPTGLGEYSL